ncbi:hypothetical protein [Aeromonas dhakensis]|uniref:hypothetical protein n=1 Tax=Aeromonas dhakensis TaxID=196024 RepID=UPI00366CECCA
MKEKGRCGAPLLCPQLEIACSGSMADDHGLNEAEVRPATVFGRRVCPSSQNETTKRHMIDFIMSLALLPNGNFT